MYPVTTDFLNKMIAQERRISGKITIDFTDVFLDQSIQVQANEQARVSYLAQTADAVSEPFAKIASLDGSCILDGSYSLAPSLAYADTCQMGWWSNQLSGADGSFIDPYPSLTVTHFARPIHSLKVVGDSKRDEYPVDFNIKLYAQDDTLLYSKNVVGNNQINWSYQLPSPVLDVVKQVLEITRWSHVGRQAKILEFFTSIQETYEGSDVFYISLLEERDVSQGSLPIGNISANEIDIKINNIDNRFDAGNAQSPLHQLLKANRRIRAWLGVNVSGQVEYVPLGVFWSGDWETPEKEVYAHTSGRDRMELLRKSTFSTSQVYADITLYDLAVIVLQDAGLKSEEYWVDPELQNFLIPYAWLDSQSHREALRKIVEACMGQAYCNREGIIRVEGPSFLESKTTSILTITNDNIWGKDNPVKWSEIANYIEVTTSPLRPVSVAEEIYRSNSLLTIPAGGQQTITVYYNSTPCIEAAASLEGATNTSISAITYYAWGANVTLNNSGGSAEDVTIVINGKPLKVLNKEKAIAQDADSITDNGKLKYTFPENPLIQTLPVAQAIADKILAVFKNPRRDISLDWRGNPALELADRITAPDYKNISTQDYHIINQTLEFDGGLSSKIVGRRAT